MNKIIEIEEFDYTMDEALKNARKCYEESGNKEVIHEEFSTCNLESLIAYADEHNVKHSNVRLIPSSKKVDWGNGIEEFIDGTFTTQLADKELEDAIKELAEKLYKTSIMYYERKLEKQLEAVKWELSRKYNRGEVK